MAHAPREKAGHHAARHLRTDWPAILFVPALVAILHHTSWLDAIDGYSYLLIGNLSAVAQNVKQDPSRPRRQSGAVVALIDQHTYEARYLERSPFDRCVLYHDLKSIYDAKPHRVVVDLDLSPAVLLKPDLKQWTEPDCESQETPARTALNPETERICEKMLYCLIRGEVPDTPRVETILMSPFNASQPDLSRRQLCWQNWMERAKVRFGTAELPVTYGLVIRQFDDPRTLATVANTQTERPPIDCPLPGTTEDELRKQVERRLTPRPHKLKLIDPRRYTRDITVVPVHPSAGNPTGKTFAERLEIELDKLTQNSNYPHRVVFFGAGFGEYDAYLTPLDEAYGVEIHAAAYLTQLEPLTELRSWGRKLVEFLGDVALAALFGLVIAGFWSGYFASRLSRRARRQQNAQFYVIGLAAVYAVMVFLLCWGSLYLLRNWGIWLSPVPIALGMLIDAFLLGSVHEAIRNAAVRRVTLVDELKKRWPEGNAGEVAAVVFGRAHREPKTLADSISWFFVREPLSYYRNDRWAFAGLAFRRVTWMVVVVGGIVAVFLGEH